MGCNLYIWALLADMAIWAKNYDYSKKWTKQQKDNPKKRAKDLDRLFFPKENIRMDNKHVKRC